MCLDPIHDQTVRSSAPELMYPNQTRLRRNHIEPLRASTQIRRGDIHIPSEPEELPLSFVDHVQQLATHDGRDLHESDCSMNRIRLRL